MKEFNCRQCGSFLDQNELEEGMCPNCGTNEDLFHTEIDEEN